MSIKFICFSLIVIFIINVNFIKINIYINNEFIDKWFEMKKKKYICKKYNCYVSSSKKYDYNAKIYTRGYYDKNIVRNNKSIYILCNIEALSKYRHTQKIIKGVDRKFDVLISYKPFISKHHFPYNYYYNNIDLIINDAKKSIISLKDFMKRKEIVFIYGKAYKNRNRVCDMFNAKINVDKYGKAYKKHLKWPEDIPNKFTNKHLLIKKYKFCLAIENTINYVKWGQMHSDPIDNDYITEKLWDCMRAGSIPIYFGAENAKKYFPTNTSIIFFKDFENYNKVVEYVLKVKNNSKILNQYINWPNTYSNNWYKRMKYYSFTPCRLCRYIAKYKNYD